ncbi:MAG: amidohydrolase [Spirochaetae bacterium HGW-Spirochaetae-7]|jgi:amidohydrolase|nr:MAG: amidohydrolase [Spirochaetae bacterium HGW-Spirochaetae-7]
MTDALELLADARRMSAWLVEIRRSIHMYPELGLEETVTADLIEARLTGMGVEHARAGTAVVGLVSGARQGKTVALRADIDALPMLEATGVEYASKRAGLMHACGHDAHATILLGAARWFAEHRAEIAGNVKLLFQPAEETVGGAETMIAGGCMENPHVDYVLGLHVMPYLPVGRIETRKGALNGSSTLIDIVIRGKSCHAAYPETGVDAIMIAGQVVTALQSLVSRYASPLDAAVLTIGTIEGGTVRNIVADEVRMKATLRTTDDSVRDKLLDRAKALVEGLASSFGGSGAVDIGYGYKALVNDPEVVDVVAAAADEILGPGSVAWKEKPSMGVEDFSFFCGARAGAFYHLGCGNEARGIVSPLHSAGFDIDEACLPLGVAMQVAATLRLLEKA